MYDTVWHVANFCGSCYHAKIFQMGLNMVQNYFYESPCSIISLTLRNNLDDELGYTYTQEDALSVN